VTDGDRISTAELVADLLPLFDQLNDVLPRGEAVVTEEKVQASKGTSVPMPFSVEVFDLRMKFVTVAERYSRLIESYRDLQTVFTHPRRGRYAHQRERLVHAVERLEAHYDWAEEQKWGKGLNADLYRLRARARILIGLDSPLIRIPMPCPVCDTRGTLVRHHGWSHVKCLRCREVTDEKAYNLMVRQAVESSQKTA
jgi:hypothetical protein